MCIGIRQSLPLSRAGVGRIQVIPEPSGLDELWCFRLLAALKHPCFQTGKENREKVVLGSHLKAAQSPVHPNKGQVGTGVLHILGLKV